MRMCVDEIVGGMFDQFWAETRLKVVDGWRIALRLEGVINC